MTDLKEKFINNKDKIVGEVKEQIGKITGNQELELEGKIQSIKSDLSKEISINVIEEKIDDLKETVAGQINDLIDKNRKK